MNEANNITTILLLERESRVLERLILTNNVIAMFVDLYIRVRMPSIIISKSHSLYTRTSSKSTLLIVLKYNSARGCSCVCVYLVLDRSGKI